MTQCSFNLSAQCLDQDAYGVTTSGNVDTWADMELI